MMTMNSMQPAAAENNLRHPDGNPIRILVVDDEPNRTHLLSMRLRLKS